MVVTPSPPRCPGYPLCDRDHRGGVPGAALHSLLYVCQLPEQQAQVGATSGNGGCCGRRKKHCELHSLFSWDAWDWCRGQLMHSLDLWINKEYI